MKNNFESKNENEILESSSPSKNSKINTDLKDTNNINSIDSSLSQESENDFDLNNINDINFLKEKLQSQESDIKYLKSRLKNYDMTVTEVTRLNIEINKLNKIIKSKNEIIRQFCEILDLSKQKFQTLLKKYNSCLEKLKNINSEKNKLELKPIITIPQKNNNKNNDNIIKNYFKLNDNYLNTEYIKNSNYDSNFNSKKNFNKNKFQERSLTPINVPLNNRFKYLNKNNNEQKTYEFKEPLQTLKKNDLKNNREASSKGSNVALDYSFRLLNSLKRNMTENNYNYFNNY